MLKVFLMIRSTLATNSFRLKLAYQLISRSNCYSCFSILSLVSSDRFKAFSISNWLMFFCSIGFDTHFFIYNRSKYRRKKYIAVFLIPYLRWTHLLTLHNQKASILQEFKLLFLGPFYYFQLQREMNADTYVNHQLNSSKTKETHRFPKEKRFPKSSKLNTEAIYVLPPATSKRYTTFGYGTKINLATSNHSPPPGSYNPPSDFQKKDLKNTTTIHEGREKVTFGSFILEALKRSNHVPSPDKYNIPGIKSMIGGRIGQRIMTEPDLKEKMTIPGPGAYKVNATDLSKKGQYVLSTVRNSSSPRYFSGHSLDKSKFNKKPLPEPTYEIQEKEIGKYQTSKFRNIMTCSFSKAQRPSLQDQSKLKFPGFKYRRFSQFGS